MNFYLISKLDNFLFGNEYLLVQIQYSKNNLKTELAYRTSPIAGLSNLSNRENQLTTMLQSFIAGTGPIRFGYGGLTSIHHPFVGTDMIALSCPRPEVNGTEQEDINQNPFVKSFHSFNGIAQDFWNGVGIRRENALDFPFDFVNYWTFGVSDGILSGDNERSAKMFGSKLNFLDYATFGFSGMVKEAVSPEESFSKEHWLNSFGLAGSIFGVGKLVTSPVKKSGNATGNSNYTYNMIEKPGPLDEINQGAASTFRSGMYNVIKLESDTILYRSGKSGGGKNALGQYFTREPGTLIEGRIDSAVKAQWIDPKTGELTGSSPLETVYEIKRVLQFMKGQ